MGTNKDGVYYDPYDFSIDVDPYPVWKRLRDEAPLYYNEEHDFYALSRFDDVEQALLDWATFTSTRGNMLEYIQQDILPPAGTFICEDPPLHSVHRGLVSRVFTPKKMAALEQQVRQFCARSLDPLVEAQGFDFVRDLGAQMPMRTIGYLLGIPESDQEAIRERIDASLRLDEGVVPNNSPESIEEQIQMYAEYIDWRAEHPSSDLMTELLTTEFEDENGVKRTLTRQEALAYTALISGAGDETTTRLIGWAGKVLAEHPDQRRHLVADHSLIATAIEEILRYEAPSPIQARCLTRDVHLYGQTVPSGSVMALLNGSANRDERRFLDPDRFHIHREVGHHLSFGYGVHFCLGAALARLEGRIAIDEVLRRWSDWEVDYDNAVQAHTATVRGWERLPVITL
jgi:cytochrome P450